MSHHTKQLIYNFKDFPGVIDGNVCLGEILDIEKYHKIDLKKFISNYIQNYPRILVIIFSKVNSSNAAEKMAIVTQKNVVIMHT